MTVLEFVNSTDAITSCFQEGTIRVHTIPNPDADNYSDLLIDSVDLITTDLTAEAVCNDMYNSGLRISNITSDGATLNIQFIVAD